MKSFYKGALNASHNRQDDVLNYFEKHITNTYIESIKRLTKSINQIGGRYSLDVVRAKMLYDVKIFKKGAMVECKKITDKTIGKDFDPVGSIGYADLMSKYTSLRTTPKTKVVEKVVYYGTDIATLCDILESGEFD